MRVVIRFTLSVTLNSGSCCGVPHLWHEGLTHYIAEQEGFEPSDRLFIGQLLSREPHSTNSATAPNAARKLSNLPEQSTATILITGIKLYGLGGFIME